MNGESHLHIAICLFLILLFFYVHTTQGLWKQCKHYEEWDDNYRQMMKLSDLPGSQPEGYLVRFPFYALAERDAHIVFSETENPDWIADDVYEFGKRNFVVVFFVFVGYCKFWSMAVLYHTEFRKLPCLEREKPQSHLLKSRGAHISRWEFRQFNSESRTNCL